MKEMEALAAGPELNAKVMTLNTVVRVLPFSFSFPRCATSPPLSFPLLLSPSYILSSSRLTSSLAGRRLCQRPRMVGQVRNSVRRQSPPQRAVVPSSRVRGVQAWGSSLPHGRGERGGNHDGERSAFSLSFSSFRQRLTAFTPQFMRKNL